MKIINLTHRSNKQPFILITTFLLILTALISSQRQTTLLEVETAESAPLQGNDYWSQIIGGETAFNTARTGLLTTSGSLYLAGTANSFGAGNTDGWVIKLDQAGQIQWQKTYGGTIYDYLQNPIETNDGNIIVVGASNSFNQTGDIDGWILKLDPNGAIIWQKTYGSPGNDGFGKITTLNDGGFIVSGGTDPDDDGKYSAWVVRLDSAGNVNWEKAFGSLYSDYILQIKPTTDGGFIAVGLHNQVVGTNGAAWIIKLNSTGAIQWEYTYGSDAPPINIYELSDGNFIAQGTINVPQRNSDMYLLKIDNIGQIIWEKSIGTNGFESGEGFLKISDNEFLAAGRINEDFWLLKLDGAGNIIWQKSYGEQDKIEAASSLQQAANGDLYLIGSSETAFVGKTLIVKVDSNGNANNCNLGGSPNATIIDLTTTPNSVNPINQTLNSTVNPSAITSQDSPAAASFLCGGPPISTISGQVLDNNGLPLPNTTIGYQTGSVTTDAGGNYTINNLPSGTYTLVPSLAGYAFTPSNHSVTVPPDQSNLDFVGTPIIYTEFVFLPILVD